MASKSRDIKELAVIAQDESTDVVQLTRDELTALIQAGRMAQPNPAPAIEEGPHLEDPAIREAKIRQLQEAEENGDLDHEVLNDAMRDLLTEKVEG